MNQENERLYDYGTAIGIAKFVSFLDWLAVIAGAAITVFLVKQGEMALLEVPSSITIALIGLVLVIGGQASRAVMDNANHSKEILNVAKSIALLLTHNQKTGPH